MAKRSADLWKNVAFITQPPVNGVHRLKDVIKEKVNANFDSLLCNSFILGDIQQAISVLRRKYFEKNHEQ